MLILFGEYMGVYEVETDRVPSKWAATPPGPPPDPISSLPNSETQPHGLSLAGEVGSWGGVIGTCSGLGPWNTWPEPAALEAGKATTERKARPLSKVHGPFALYRMKMTSQIAGWPPHRKFAL